MAIFRSCKKTWRESGVRVVVAAAIIMGLCALLVVRTSRVHELPTDLAAAAAEVAVAAGGDKAAMHTIQPRETSHGQKNIDDDDDNEKYQPISVVNSHTNLKTIEKTASKKENADSKKIKKANAKQQTKGRKKKKKKKKKIRYSEVQYQRDQISEFNWTQAMSEKVREELAKREAGVVAGCRSQELQKAPKSQVMSVVRNMVHVKKNKFMWCPVHKAASTTWAKNVLRLVENSSTQAFQKNARTLNPPPRDTRELHHLPKDTSWLLIVRHPLQRLLSAYRDKMLRQRKEHETFMQLQREVAVKYKDPNRTYTSNDTHNGPPHIPTFTQFLLKAKDDVEQVWTKKKRSVNQHWSPYWLLCAPCQLHYNLIAHVETFTRDQEYLIHHLHMEDQAVNIHSHASNFDSYEGTDEATQHYYSQVPRELLDQIVQLYLPDFILFGYSPQPYLDLTTSADTGTEDPTVTSKLTDHPTSDADHET